MKRLNFVNTNNKRIILTLSFALILLATTTLTGTSSLQLIKPAMAKKLISNDEIADNAVTSPKIADGTITGNDVSTAFMKRVTLNDDAAGHAQGWNPDGINQGFVIYDNDVDESDSTFVSIMLNGIGTINHGINGGVCAVYDVITGLFQITCAPYGPANAPQDGSQLHYIVFKLPAHTVTSSASATETSSSTSSSAPTISSPFSSLGDVNPK